MGAMYCCSACLMCLVVEGRFRTVTCRQIRLAHSSVCQGSHTLAHPSDLRLGKGCKTLLSLSAVGATCWWCGWWTVQDQCCTIGANQDPVPGDTSRPASVGGCQAGHPCSKLLQFMPADRATATRWCGSYIVADTPARRGCGIV